MPFLGTDSACVLLVAVNLYTSEAQTSTYYKIPGPPLYGSSGNPGSVCSPPCSPCKRPPYGFLPSSPPPPVPAPVVCPPLAPSGRPPPPPVPAALAPPLLELLLNTDSAVETDTLDQLFARLPTPARSRMVCRVTSARSESN